MASIFWKARLFLKYRKEALALLGDHLRMLESSGMEAPFGGLSDEEIGGLIGWLPDTGVFVEIGTLFGLTAKAVCAAKPDLKIVAVDNFSWNPFGMPPALHEQFTRRILLNEIASGQVKVVKASSSEYRKKCHAVPDAVFLDALHQYEPVRDEIAWAKSSGVRCICGHDYGNPSPVFGVTRAVDEAFHQGGVDVCGMCWHAREIVQR